jgi:hypothetical protein
MAGSFDDVEIRNLAPGFEYDLVSNNGGLSLVALNDGVFVPEPSAMMAMTCFAITALLPRGRRQHPRFEQTFRVFSHANFVRTNCRSR